MQWKWSVVLELCDFHHSKKKQTWCQDDGFKTIEFGTQSTSGLKQQILNKPLTRTVSQQQCHNLGPITKWRTQQSVRPFRNIWIEHLIPQRVACQGWEVYWITIRTSANWCTKKGFKTLWRPEFLCFHLSAHAVHKYQHFVFFKILLKLKRHKLPQKLVCVMGVSCWADNTITGDWESNLGTFPANCILEGGSRKGWPFHLGVAMSNWIWILHGSDLHIGGVLEQMLSARLKTEFSMIDKGQVGAPPSCTDKRKHPTLRAKNLEKVPRGLSAWSLKQKSLLKRTKSPQKVSKKCLFGDFWTFLGLVWDSRLEGLGRLLGTFSRFSAQRASRLL